MVWSLISSLGLLLQLGNRRLTGVEDELTSNDNDGLFKNYKIKHKNWPKCLKL